MIKIIAFKYKLKLYVFLFSNIYISLGNSLLRGEISSDRTDNPDDMNRFSGEFLTPTDCEIRRNKHGAERKSNTRFPCTVSVGKLCIL